MLGKHTRVRLSVAGLHGKAFQPPRDPAIVRATRRTKWADRRGARQIGQAEAEGHSLTDGEKSHYEGVIEEQASQARAETREGHQLATANNENAAEDARQQKVDAEGRIENVEQQDAQDAEVERERADLRGLGPIAYALIMIFCYIATLPQDAAAATGLPLSATMQLIVALTIGGVLMLAAHLDGDKWRELDDARATRAEDPGRFERLKHELIVGIAIPITVIVGVAIWRGETFAAQSELVGGLFTSPTSANLAFALLATCAFLVATLAARAYSRLKPLHQIRRKRAHNKKERDQQQSIADIAERVDAQAQLNVQHITNHLAKTEEKIDAWKAARTKRLRYCAGVAQRKHRRKLMHQGLLPTNNGNAKP